MKGRPVLSLFMLLLIIALACNLPAGEQNGLNRPGDTSAIQEGEPDQEPMPPQALPPDTGDSSQQCAYQWASQALPELSEKLQDDFDEAGMKHIRVRAEAFGENCILPDGRVGGFLVMQTDLRFTVGVADIHDYPSLATQVREILRIIFGMPLEQFPGPNKGYIGISFSDLNGASMNLWFPRQVAEQAVQENLDGAALIEWLRSR